MYKKTYIKKRERTWAMRRGRIERTVRREAAEMRQEKRNSLGDAGQLAKLERNGHGHCKEAARLRARLKGETDGSA